MRRGEEDGAPENNELRLKWVHGYNHEGRGTVRYTSDGSVCYYAASLAVVMKPPSVKKQADKTQEFNFGHGDDVTSIAMHPSNNIVATGERGKKPSILIWDSKTMNTLHTLKGFHRRSVANMAFSHDGKFLISIGGDDDHSIAIYDWKNDKIKTSCKGDKSKILDVVFDPADSGAFATVGVKHVKFWSVQGQNVSGKKGVLGKRGKLQAFVAAEFVGKDLVVGTADGSIYRFVERNLKKVVKAHSKAVNTFFKTPDYNLISGGRDGTICFFDASLNKTRSIDLREIHKDIFRFGVKSVCLNGDGDRLLVGTDGSQIFELSASSGEDLHDGPIVSGHCKDELWGLAENPVRREYCSVGDDGSLRVWDVATKTNRRENGFKDLGGMARAVCYDPKGEMIAVGFGGTVGRGRQKCDGEFLVLDAKTLEIIHKGKDSKEWIQCIKFSPDGKTLAIGSHDNSIYLYECKKKFKLRAKFSKHNSFITHFDFSADSQFLASNCGAYELLFSDVFTGNQIGSASSLRDTDWSSYTLTLGWPVQGIYPPEADGTDVNSACRSHAGQVIATTDDSGLVKLFNYPCTKKGANFSSYGGHGSHVTNSCWTVYDECLITAGGGDRCIFQWKHDIECEDEVPPVLDDEEEEEEEEFGSMSEAASPKKLPKNKVEMGGEVEMSDAGSGDSEGGLGDFSGERGGGDEFMAVKPYLGAITEPTRKEPPEWTNNPKKPEAKLEVDFVFGYNSGTGGSNLRYNSSNDIVYHGAALGIVLKKNQSDSEGNTSGSFDHSKMTQQFCVGHDDDISAFAISDDKSLIATGQMGKAPTIKIWDAASSLCLATLKHKDLKREVMAVSFNAAGDKMCGIGADDNHTCVLWSDKGGRWSKPVVGASGKGDKGKVLWALFDPATENVVIGGMKFVKILSASGKDLTAKKGVFGKVGKAQPLPCGTFLDNGKLVTGTADGSIYQWEGRDCKKSVKCTDSTKLCAIMDVRAATADSIKLISGAKDGKICLFDESLAILRTLNMSSIDCLVKNVISVDISSTGKQILVGTQGSEIVEIDTETGSNSAILMSGHYKDEVWGLGVHNSNPDLFATSGDDGTVRVWSLGGKKLLCSESVGDQSRAVSFNGDYVCAGIGGEEGRKKKRAKGVLAGGYSVFKFDSNNPSLSKIAEDRCAKEWVSDLKFSPSGKLLAVGSHDNKIYLYDVDRESGTTKKVGVCAKHNSYITHVDFTKDETALMSTCGAYELLWFSTRGKQMGSKTEMQQIPSATSMRDQKYSPFTCTLGWPVQGIFPDGADGTDVNAVCIDDQNKWVISGDDNGKVNLFNFPCLSDAECVEGIGHSSHVTNIRFVRNEGSGDDGVADSRDVFVSAGGKDRCIFVWKIVT